MTIPEHEYRSWDAVRMAQLVREREVSAAELAQTADALLASHPELNAVAGRAEPDERVSPDPAGVLFGVPFAVKEVLAWPGLAWSMGSRLTAGQPAPGLSPYAGALVRAGLRALWSTTSSEFGLLGSTETALHGITANPWGAGLSPGGSSGGSAALVAAGVLPIAHGNDAGGSLRVPASLTGIVGFLPSAGRCAPTGQDVGGLTSLVVDHVLSRSVRDSAQVLAVTERTGADAVHPPIGLVSGPASRRLRIGVVSTTLTGGQPDSVVGRELQRAAALCAELEHQVDVAAPPAIDGAALSRAFFTSAALTMTQVARFAAGLLGRPPGPDEFEPFTRELIDWAGGLDPEVLAGVQDDLTAAARSYLALFERHDVVLSPTLASASVPTGHLAPTLGREELIRRTERIVGYTPIHNPAGCPAISLPLGSDDAGSPIGIHCAAAPGQDALLLSLAHELEQAAPWAQRRPGMMT